MADSELITTLIQQGVPAFLVIGGALWFAFFVFPWWRDRDALKQDRQQDLELKRLESEQGERDRQHDLELKRLDVDQEERDRHHELEQRQIETDGLMASALTVLADAVRSCPVNVAVNAE